MDYYVKSLLIALILLVIAGCTQRITEPSKLEAPQTKSITDPKLRQQINEVSWRDWLKEDELRQVEAKYESSEIKEFKRKSSHSVKELFAKIELRRDCMRERIGTDYMDAVLLCMKHLN